MPDLSEEELSLDEMPDNYVIFNSFDNELEDSIEKVLLKLQRLLESSKQKQDTDKCESIQRIIDTLTNIKQANSQEIKGKVMIETYLFRTLFESE